MRRRGYKSITIIIIIILSFLELEGYCHIAPGSVSGYVFNYYGLAIPDAIVGFRTGPITTSDSNGYFILENLPSGPDSLGCGKEGYNSVWIDIEIIPGDTILQNFTLTQPAMIISPLVINSTLNPGEYLNTPVSILNTGTGPLNWLAEIDYLSIPVIPCEYSIALYDTWGDGWNGCSINVLVNDTVVLDHITLSSGSGPAVFYFMVKTGDQITTDFIPGPFFTEPYYFIYNSEGEQVWYSPASASGPPDVLTGQLAAGCTGGQWLTLDQYDGSVLPFGGLQNVPLHLDASGTESGESYQANITFASDPDIGEVVIPVTMNILGSTIQAPQNLSVDLSDPWTGSIELNWEWESKSFQFFVIKRDGMIISTTSGTNYTDILPAHGTYCYTVQAVYNEGLSSPAGPECIEWPDPVINISPDELEGWVWTGYTVDVFTTISNQGEGSLYYSFPEFAALHLLKDPVIEKNIPGSIELPDAQITGKGDNSRDGQGYPVVLGAGGPDNFGYIWIDSDEEGGPIFTYTDISTTGTPVFGLSDDNIVGPFNIGFEFYFYGDIKNQFWINSNGCIGFTSNKITNANTTLPTNSSVYKDFIAWMWDDLVFKTGSSQVFYQFSSDKLIIQFKNYEHWGQANLPINAEVVLYKNGKILLLYDSFAQGITLNSCTVGIQSVTPSLGLQVAYNTNYLHNHLAILLNVPGDFITDVEPAFGTIPSGGSEVITITYDSKDYIPGPYTQDLSVESNDLNHPGYTIENTMNVYAPAIFSGVVYDHDNEEPLNGVMVTAGPFQASTGENGEYTLYVDEGVYDVKFNKLGYMPVTVRDTMALTGDISTINTGLWDKNYAPGMVHAEVMDNDTWCEITWTLPEGPYEIMMDDGEADDFFVYAHGGSWNAVKFTPAGYPATVIGGCFNVGDGSFPGPFLGSEFGVAVFDDDGPNGFPGTMLDSSGVTVNNSGWVNLDWLNAQITDGSFYLAMYQDGNVPHVAPIGVDTDNPTYFRSYTKFQAGTWNLSPLQDFMMRAWVNGPQSDNEIAGTIADLPNRNVVGYMLAHYVDFNPADTLIGGYFSDFAQTGNLYYNDFAWSGTGQGWRAYGVKALYTSGLYSEYTLSNIVGHLMDCNATFNISLTTGLPAENVEITLTGLDYPFEKFSGTTLSSGNALFENIWKGHYNILIDKIGFDPYLLEEVEISSDQSFDIILSEKKYPPDCLYVDPLTLKATWCYPMISQLDENFEKPDFPPDGWQNGADCNTTAWFRTSDGSNNTWEIPPWDSYYAAYLDYATGSDENGCLEYLITPPVDLRESQDFVLSFNSYYDGMYGQLAFIEYSYDAGLTWEVLYQVTPSQDWEALSIDLGAFGGPEQPDKMWFAFHASYGGFGSGWAIDNVKLNVPSQPALYQDFSVFLDDIFIGQTETTDWNYAPLEYGQTYTASVAAHYSSGLSKKDNYTFECRYLVPPKNLIGTAPDDAALLSWDPPGPGLPYNLLGYKLYKDDSLLAYQEHNGGWERQSYSDINLQPGIYTYTITSVYDLEPYGFPGETGESMSTEPTVVYVDYCSPLEFVETWDIGTLGQNNWLTDGPNWSINGQTGNPAPVVEFNWSPLQEQYEQYLESYPLCAVGLTEGNIWLDFDLSLANIQPTGNEHLNVEVWNWTDHDWITVAVYSNDDGSYDWVTQRIDISSIALDKVFKIRFKAYGTFSPDIRGWFIDNIHVYRICPAPQNLITDPDFYEGIRLTWEFPEQHNEGSEVASRELVGYYIYRSENGGDYELLTDNYVVMPYVDPDSNLALGALYCYKVSAVYESESDQCVSELSNEACALWTGTGESNGLNGLDVNVYPNPAIDHLIINSSAEIHRIELINCVGNLVFIKDINANQMEIALQDYPSGPYIIRLETAEGVISRLIAIQR